MKTLDPAELKKNFADVRKRYEQNQRSLPISILLQGRPGTGKTSALLTSVRPIRIYAFDSSYESLEEVRKGVKEGWILLELLNNEKSDDPTEYKKFKEVVEEEVNSGFLNSFGTVGIDVLGGTSGGLVECVANVVRKNPKAFNVHEPEKPRPVGGLRRGDYATVYDIVRKYIRMLQTVDAMVVATMHTVIETTTREIATPHGISEVESTRVELATFSKLRPIVQSLFPERYHLKKLKSGNSAKYTMLTEFDGELDASTKIGKGKFALEETPNIRELLKKAGLPATDKPYNF